MDYQKTEQEKRTNKIDPTTNKPFLYEPTGLGDVIDTFVPIPYGPLGTPATENDVRKYEADYIQLFNELNALTADAKTKDEEVSDKQAEIFKKGEDVQAKKDEHTKAQAELKELKVKLKEVTDALAVITAAAAAATTTGATQSLVPIRTHSKTSTR
jgi:hypothetical protein